MKLDPSSLRITERQVEDFFYQDPNSIYSNFFQVERWIKRQYRIPSGIIDLLGITSRGDLAVVEIKNVEIDSRAITQVCRYAKDIEELSGIFDAEEVSKGNWITTNVIKVLVGPSIPLPVLRECEACQVLYLEFEISMTVDVSTVSWTTSFLKDRERDYKALAQDREIEEGIRECYRMQRQYNALFEHQPQENEDQEGDPS